MVVRLFWNVKRNDTLFVISCAERIHEQPTPHSIAEIKQRVRAEIKESQINDVGRFFRFRLVLVRREQMEMLKDIVFVSEIFPIPAPALC